MENLDNDLGLDLNLEIDLDDLELNLGDLGDNLQDITMVETSTKEKKEVVSKFDFLYSISPLGINFNVILKEDPKVLIDLLGIFLNNSGLKGELKEFLLESEVFLEHIRHKSKSLLNTDPELYIATEEIVETFEFNLNKIREELKMYKYDEVQIRYDTPTYRTYLGKTNNVETIDFSRLNSFDFKDSVMNDIIDTETSNIRESILYSYHNGLESVLSINENFLEFIGFIYNLILNKPTTLSLKEISGTAEFIDLKLNQPLLTNKLEALLRFQSKSYQYDSTEHKAMVALDFPYAICGREEFLKADIDGMLRDITRLLTKNSRVVKADENRTRNNMQTLMWLKQIKIFFDNKKTNSIGEIYF